ncbi:hypothetical protein [Actinocorallia herbida]|nr:hypothetical protein [Actinocorallia herbida]
MESMGGPGGGGGRWEAELAGVFAGFLGRPLAEFDGDAVHAAFFGGNFVSEVGYLRDDAWVKPAALRGAEPVVWDYEIFDEGGPLLEFDASRSVYEFVGKGLPEVFAADLAAACFEPGLARGADVAPLLDGHGIDLRAPGLRDSWYVCHPRLVSDGTLFDAMRVALRLGRGPDGMLLPPLEDTEPDEEWAGLLAGIDDPALAAHVSHFCADGDLGLMCLGADAVIGSLLTDRGSTVLAHWEEGQDQIELTVVRLGPLLGGRP